MSINSRLSPGQLAYLYDLQKNENVDLQVLLQDPCMRIPSNDYIETYTQLLAKCDTEYALYLNQFCSDPVIFFYNVLPLVKQSSVHSLNLSM